MRRARSPRGGDDAGSVTLMVIVYFLVASLLVLVIVAASAVHLERGRLIDLADAAALDAADSLESGGVFDGRVAGIEPEGLQGIPLNDASVRAVARDYAERALASEEFDGFGVVTAETGSPDGETAVVTYTARLEVPVAKDFAGPWADGIPVTATGRARGDVD